MATFETSDDLLEVSVLLPLSREQRRVPIHIVDVNGDDVTVKQVKEAILSHQGLDPSNRYTMVGNLKDSLVQMEDSYVITDYMDYILNGFISFQQR